MSEQTDSAVSAKTQTSTRSTRGLSLRTRWTIALLLLGTIPLAVLAPFVLQKQRQGLLHSEEAHQAAVMDHAGTRLENTLESAARAVSHIGRILSDPRLTDGEAKIALAQSVLATMNALDSVAIYSDSGELIDTMIRGEGQATTPAPPRLDESLRADARGRWMPPALQGRALRLRYVQPLSNGGRRTGFVLGQLRENVVNDQFEELSRDHFEGRNDGLVLLDPSLTVLVASGSAGPMYAVGASLRGRELLSKINVPEERFAVNFLSSGEYQDAGGQDWVGSLRTVPGLRVGVLARRPSASVFSGIAATRRAVLGAVLLLILLSLIVGTTVAARTTRPVGSLIALARSYAARRFETRSDVRSGDELEVLGATMEQMADDLSASEDEIARRAAVEENLSRFLPASVAQEIAEGKRTLALGGERREVSVLFADVVSFTPFVERAGAEQVVEFLNELFTVLTEVVFRHQGTVDKFMGDSVMAFFGAPNAMSDHAERALLCAEDMHRFVEATAPSWLTKYGIDVRIAIGVNSGEVIVGNLGSERRMEYTVIGDAVNVAARLEGVARAGQTLVTQVVADKAGDAFEFKSIGEHPLRGKEQPVPILEMLR
ncbi:MAG: adenylate/guanylate cyclase domain-containing protein [Deltaproteobacteria bacterium]|nr:adenylate/guanylate cyclase domain-containing protein [Deltaproteobacteria bacterium]